MDILHSILPSIESSEKMPVLFVGHGSPMYAIEENKYVAQFRKIGQQMPIPKAILCISAHWETHGTQVTAMENPKTIHDFGGFPPALYQVEYPAAGSPSLAHQTQQLITKTEVELDHKWGLDHGCWSVLKHIYPKANIPVVQLSLDYSKTAQSHFEIAKELVSLRHKGVLIVGSGNIIHNLRMIAWDKMNVEGFGFDWAIEANEKMKAYILQNDFQSLINYKTQGKAFELAIPSPEHYLPLLYSLALKDDTDSLQLFNDDYVAGSLAMTSVLIGA